ncbi:hypothetical protein U728_1248 [Clostridium botulinum 202F]|nr:hypothetical protein U728_1248 [Clostridium botulinum 202F]KAI3346979.1 hypothetical protein CIT17_08395 [Clostridium botulinum]KON13684.1 hypothetical protein ACP50_06370 [Clostridium botulinum]MBY6987230.1 hypothetical protein [Clostridium botulinum]NFG99669.1 hypothetical protein [Clostridium botulinum]
MTNVKEWLETTGLNVAETCFKKPPKLPYIIFIMDENSSGADRKLCISDRDITTELYSDIINREKERLIEDLLKEKSINYSKSRVWLDSEKMFETSYDFNLYEKMEE